jgi:MFS transporter, CP family, cyanate transporter
MSQESADKRLILFALLWLSGVCLRLTVLAVPPLVPLLHAEFHLTETGVGWLSSLPPMMFAIAAVPGALLIARFGVVPALLVGLVLNAVGGAARAAATDTAFLYGATIMMAAGVSIMQPALPPLVRDWFADRIGFATAVYTNGLLVAEVTVVALTIPVLLPLLHGSWRLDFMFWSLPCLATALLLAALAPRRVDTAHMPQPASSRWWPDWRSPLIWRLSLILGTVNTTYFVTNAFLPDFVIAAGRPDLVSAALTAINFGQLPGSMLMLMLASRLVRRPAAYVVTASVCVTCLIGIMVMSGAWIVFWSGLLGCAVGVALNLALALPPILSAPGDVHRVSAGMFTIGYTFPVLVAVLGGWLWDYTGLPIAGFAPVLLFQFAVMTVAWSVKPADRPTTVV